MKRMSRTQGGIGDICDVMIWSQEIVHEGEINKEEVCKDKTDRNKVDICVSQV